MTPLQHLQKATRIHAGGAHLLAGGFREAAGREAYLAALHAALAYIVYRTGKAPKTHSGARSEFSRLAREDGCIDPSHAIFLGRAHELKTVADYDQVVASSHEDARRALEEAGDMIEALSRLVVP